MKIRIEMTDEVSECEVVIKCNTLDDEVLNIQRNLERMKQSTSQFVLYKDETEYYLNLSDLLFFETDGNTVNAHTVDDVFKVKYKLYELEELLPRKFVRISKSAIVNSEKIYSIQKNLTASSLIEFKNTHKQIYVSRSYYKLLKNIMEGRGNNYEI